MIIAICLVILGLLLIAVVAYVIRRKQMHIWLPDYLRRLGSWRDPSPGPIHIMFAFVDHYEPQWGRVEDINVERARVDRWLQDYPRLAGKHRDADGRHPCHSFFYPEEEYRKEHLDKIADICRQDMGEIEVHLHHHDDTRANFEATLSRFVDVLHRDHDALSRDPDTGQLAYAFIHGNWSLCNSRGDGQYCGINDELPALRDTGCYADFTLPSAPSDTQTRKVNAIYYASDKPGHARSHDSGEDVCVGKPASGDLMIIQGPLGLNWKARKLGIMPSIENADIRASYPPTKERVDLWVNSRIHVKGRPEWLFVKIHTHGTQDMDMDCLLGEPVDEMFSYLESKYNDGKKYKLHYVSAREMYNIVKAAEAGEKGDPGLYRDYLLPRPGYKAEEP